VVTMKNDVFWVVMMRGSCKNLRFGGTYSLHYQGDRNRRVFLRNVFRLLVTATVIPSSPTLVTQMMEALRSFETSVLTRATRVTSQKTAFFLLFAYDIYENIQWIGLHSVK
jgi:hypothetical protein